MAQAINPEIISKVRSLTGLVRLEGPITWAQQQMIEKMNDPVVKRLVEIVQGLDISKRTWDRALEAFSKTNS